MPRIIFVIAVFLFSLTSVMGQMIPITLPADGNWPTIVGDSIMIIGPRQNELTEEQRYFNPIYLMTYPGKEHLKAQMIRAGACDCDPTKPNRRIGVFSVAPDKKVSFSQGNLQYLPAIRLWKFADTQYEYLGNANKYLKPTFRNWVDLFGWSANNTTAPFGVSISTNAADYAGDFVDWGTNAICGDAPGTWRTLSIEEWEYIYHGRKNADQLLAIATLEGVPGLILLPDNWQQPEDIPFVSSVEQGLAWDATRLEGSYFDATNKDHTKDNIYTQAQWQKMEALGAVFLPCAGWRQEKTWTHAGIVEVNIKYLGSYWSCSTPQISNDYYFFRFTQQEIRKFPLNNSLSLLARGRSVRLVHDTIVPESIPEPCLVVKVNDTLSINMMCVEGGTFTMGDGENAHPVSLSSYSIGQSEVTQALWETVMGTNPSANTANKQLPVTNISWYDCQEFIKKLNQQTGMRFRLPTEAEWEYAARGGQKSKGYTYAGSNDLKEVAWYNGNSANTLHAVAQKKPNELGIYDMSGNAWEWCHDWHAPYPTTHQYNPLGPEVGKVVGKRYLRVFRGGSYGYEAAYLQNVFRDITGPEPNIGTGNLGLRLVLSDDVNFQTIHVNDTLSFHMMDVKGGTFMMGAMESDKQAHANEKPAHQVTLTYDYYIGQTEVTQALWQAVMGNNPSTMIGDDLPVNNVLWEEADAFVKRLSQMTGYTFHLPTEAEWEFAARGGNKSQGYLYAGSNNIQEVAWYGSNSGNTTQPVGTKQPNELGIYDMSGNVIEWCSDWLGPYSAEAQVNPIGPATGAYHVYCGGCWYLPANVCRCTHRRQTTAGYGEAAVGLRVALREKVEPEAIDLGLSVKWANFNVGAFHPTHCGDYFAWGETEPKETYSWATYKWCDGTEANITKYNTADGKTILEPADDAAQVQWGGKWRMPTKEEIQELFTRCTWKTETQNGINGYNVIGPNGNSIFVPTAGWYNEDDFGVGLQGNATYYWTSTLSSSNKIRAYDLVFNDVSGSNDGIIANTRRCGFPIRPVYDDRPTLTVIPTPEDAKVTFLCKGYQAVGHSITVDKGKDVLYQVTNVDAGYLSQGDSIYKLTKDSVLCVTLRPFSDGNWVVVDNSELTKYENYYISRNGGSFAGPYSNWNYYVLPVMAGETYRVRAVAGQLAPVWFIASTAPDLETKTRPTKVSCSDNKGFVAYIADEVTIPSGGG